LKQIYSIPLNSTTLHFTHGAHADIIRNVMNSEFVLNEEEQTDTTNEDFIDYGKCLGVASTYLSEALDYAIRHTSGDTNSNPLSLLYNSLPAQNYSELSAIIEKACTLLHVNWEALLI